MPHDALVTQVWRNGDRPDGMNLVFVSSDESRMDSCGRQIERQTSVVHQSVQVAAGNYWQ